MSVALSSCAVSNDGLSTGSGAGDDGGAGGAFQADPPTGGTLGTGGVVGTGGKPGTGGTLGGVTGTGGALGTGGAPGTGGTLGSGGAPGTGGTVSTGGAPGTGGIQGTGGTPGAGGAIGGGGAPGLGGAVGSGGAGGSGGTGGMNPGGLPGSGGAMGGSGGTQTGANPCQEARGELVACFPFDGSVQDGSKSALDARASSSVFVQGVEGKSIVMGPGRVVRVASNAVLNLSLFTLETTVRPDRLPAPGTRMGLIDSDLRYGLFVMPEGGLLCSSSAGTVVANSAIQAGKWHHVACIRSAASIALWVDGRDVATLPIVSVPAAAPTKELVVGGNEPSGDEFEGLMDTTRIWRTARRPEL